MKNEQPDSNLYVLLYLVYKALYLSIFSFSVGQKEFKLRLAPARAFLSISIIFHLFSWVNKNSRSM